MPTITYTVAVSFRDPTVADDWLKWLVDGHIADVIAAGALDAEIVELDGPHRSFEIRYHFRSRESFELYEKEHAPRLRAEGLKFFPPERGVIYRRTSGVVVNAGWDRLPRQNE